MDVQTERTQTSVTSWDVLRCFVFAVYIFKTISYSFPSFSNHFWIRLKKKTRTQNHQISHKTRPRHVRKSRTSSSSSSITQIHCQWWIKKIIPLGSYKGKCTTKRQLNQRRAMKPKQSVVSPSYMPLLTDPLPLSSTADTWKNTCQTRTGTLLDCKNTNQITDVPGGLCVPNGVVFERENV